MFSDKYTFCMRYPQYSIWLHCCKRPNYEFCISQGSVATVFKWGRQNYSRLRYVSSWCCMSKITKIGQCFMELFKNNTGTVFFETRCIYATVTTTTTTTSTSTTVNNSNNNNNNNRNNKINQMNKRCQARTDTEYTNKWIHKKSTAASIQQRYIRCTSFVFHPYTRVFNSWTQQLNK